MLDQVAAYGLYGSTYACIEFSDFEGIPVYHSLKSKRSNGSFGDINSSSFKKLEQLTDWLGKQGHSVLIVNNAQVLIKHLPEVVEFSEDLVLKAFPGIRMDDFYYQAVEGNDGFFIAICRKSVVEAAIEELKKSKIHVVAVSLGFSGIAQLKKLFVEEVRIPSASGSVLMDIDGISGYESNPLESRIIQLQSDEIESSHALTLSGLSSYMVPVLNSNLKKLNETLRDENKNNRIFSISWKFAAAVLFLLLIVNALAFNNLYSKKQELTEQSELVKTQQESYTLRKSQLEKREALVGSILSNTGSKSSFYLNRIVATIPDHIQLSKFNFQPFEGSIRPDKEIKVLTGLIQMDGVSKDSDRFGSWIAQLEDLEFTTDVQVDGYSDDTRGSNFSITLTLIIN